MNMIFGHPHLHPIHPYLFSSLLEAVGLLDADLRTLKTVLQTWTPWVVLDMGRKWLEEVGGNISLLDSFDAYRKEQR